MFLSKRFFSVEKFTRKISRIHIKANSISFLFSRIECSLQCTSPTWTAQWVTPMMISSSALIKIGVGLDFSVNAPAVCLPNLQIVFS